MIKNIKNIKTRVKAKIAQKAIERALPIDGIVDIVTTYGGIALAIAALYKETESFVATDRAGRIDKMINGLSELKKSL